MKNKNFNTKYDGNFNPYVYSEISCGSVCLDVGCWKGSLGERLIEKKNCTVDGIDVNKQALKEAHKRGYRNITKADINCDDLKEISLEGKYDVIIFADVLEHLVDPGKTLKLFGEYLKKDGKIIISIPNIAFIKQRVDLLLGRFEYNPKGGIMDESHLKFFTYSSFKNLVLSSNLQIHHSYGYSLVSYKYIFLKYLARWMPSLFALQLLFVLEPE